MLPQGTHASFQVLMGASGFLLSHSRGIGPHLEFRQETQGSSPVVTGISGFISSFNRGVRPQFVLMDEILLSSRVVKWVSELLSSSDGKLVLFLEVQQGNQKSLHVVRGSSGFHLSQCRGIRPYLQVRGNKVSFLLATGIVGHLSSFNGRDRPSLECEGKFRIPLESKQGNRPSSQEEVGNTGLFLSCGRKFGVPLECRWIMWNRLS